MDKLDRYLGCRYGLSLGDALGAPVEFSDIFDIKSKYGKNGVDDLYPYSQLPAGSYTDDTQMTIATILGLINSSIKNINPIVSIYQQYLEWLITQHDSKNRRSPGRTCLSALSSSKIGTMNNPLNNSKGCGGVMRVAPIGFAFSSGDSAFLYGAKAAAITHGHPSGYLSAGFLSELIYHLSKKINPVDAIILTRQSLIKYSGHKETLSIVDKACNLSLENRSIESSIKSLGKGWVGEEALAISIYCSLKYRDDWKAGVFAAVNHSGDSDSTGSITGAILGTLLGIEAIPLKMIQTVENTDYIKSLSLLMYNTFKEIKLP